MTDTLWQKKGIRLRAPEPEDLDRMMQLENDPDAWLVSGVTGPYSRFQLKRYIEENQNDLFLDLQMRFMIENEQQEVVGNIDLFHYDPMHNRAEVGIVVAAAHRRKGIGRMALGLLEEHCFHRLGIHQLYAYITAENLSSRRLFASCGYREGTVLKEWSRRGNGDYVDVVIVQKINR